MRLIYSASACLSVHIYFNFSTIGLTIPGITNEVSKTDRGLRDVIDASGEDLFLVW